MKRNSFSLILSGLIFFLSFSLAGCASFFNRSAGSGYAGSNYEVEIPDIRRDRETMLREDTLSEMGYQSRELGPEQQAAFQHRLYLKSLEKNIDSRREREQYFKAKPYFANDRERIEFLRMNGYEARQRWLDARGISPNAMTFSADVQELIEQNDIAVGMTKQAVRESWGDPEIVEVAGNPLYGNERWKYSEDITSSDGYKTESRMIYFESGRVVGWESF